MKKAFISILGTNDYLECRHSFNGLTTDAPVKYCQEDLLKIFCKDFDEESEIRIFLTEDAKEKNWLDNGHRDLNGNPIPNIGLENRIKQLQLPSKVKAISIQEGYTEEAIWENFRIMFESFRDEEEVIVDVTHSFRSLPILMITLLNFARQVKKIKVKGIYYAAFEALGTIQEMRKIKPEDRIVQILNLTTFSELQDWTTATYDFINNANAKSMHKLISESSKVTSNEPFRIEKLFPRKVVEKLDLLINDIALCRGKELFNFNYQELKNDISSLKDYKSIPVAFNYLIDELYKKVEPFNNNLEELTLTVAEWCIKHNLIQQAITLLQEFTITFILQRNQMDVQDHKNRELVAQAFRIASQNIDEQCWKEPASCNKEIVKKILRDELLNKLCSDFSSLTDLRNDVNHGGFLSDSRSIEKIKGKLKALVDSYKKKLSFSNVS